MPIPRIIVTLTKKQIKELNKMIKSGVYQNRSEAIRDSIRKLIREDENYFSGKQRLIK